MNTFDDFYFLYVEDDPHSRNVMQMIMKNGMKVRRLTIFEDSEDFMSRLRALETIPNVIMLDIHVRPFNGYQMLDMIRADPAYDHVKIIALTASVMNEEVDQLRSKGFDGTISKPVRIQVFPKLMKQVVEGESVWHIS